MVFCNFQIPQNLAHIWTHKLWKIGHVLTVTRATSCLSGTISDSNINTRKHILAWWRDYLNDVIISGVLNRTLQNMNETGFELLAIRCMIPSVSAVVRSLLFGQHKSDSKWYGRFQFYTTYLLKYEHEHIWDQNVCFGIYIFTNYYINMCHSLSWHIAQMCKPTSRHLCWWY